MCGEKGMGKMDWTSLMGNEKKKLLRMLPIKLTESNDAIHPDSKDTVVKLWMVRKLSFPLVCTKLQKR